MKKRIASGSGGQPEAGPARSRTEVTFCPECLRPVEANDYSSQGAALSVDTFFPVSLPTIECGCGYYGLPVTLPMRDYRKLRGRKKPG